MAALGITYVPMALAGNGFYEHSDTLMVFVLVLVPLGAGVGPCWARIRQVGTAPSRARVAGSVLAVVALLLVLWQVWANLTRAPGLL